MIRIGSSDEMLQLFRPMDRDKVHLPSDMSFPRVVRDYLAWVEPSGHRVFLVFEDRARGEKFGIVFKRASAAPDVAPQMCEWCHSCRSGSSVGMLTVDISPKRRIGLYLCRDLSCKEKALRAPGANDIPEGLEGEDKVERILRRMTHFARLNLF